MDLWALVIGYIIPRMSGLVTEAAGKGIQLGWDAASKTENCYDDMGMLVGARLSGQLPSQFATEAEMAAEVERRVKATGTKIDDAVWAVQKAAMRL